MTQVVLYNKTQLCELIPHSGLMCLLDEVIEWDAQHVVCLSRTHLQMDNPLRTTSGLPMNALIEYGAQAMAVHGGIQAKQQGTTIEKGYLVALRNVKLAGRILSDCNDSLQVEAKQEYADQGNMIYQFIVSHQNTELVNGRATVMSLEEGNV